MKRRESARLVLVVVALAVALGFVYLMLHRGGHEQKQVTLPKNSTTNSAPKATDQSTTTTQANPPSKVKPKDDPKMVQLKVVLSNFIKTYYYETPKDTEESRKARVSTLASSSKPSNPMIPAQTLDRMDFGLGVGTVEGVQRLQNNLIKVGEAAILGLRVHRVSADPLTLYASVPVAVALAHSDGSVESSYIVNTVSKWQYTEGKWLLLGFVEGDEGE